MTEFAKREIRDWLLTLVTGMFGGMIASAITMGWAIHVYHGG